MGLVAYCGFTGSPSQLRQPETVKFRVVVLKDGIYRCWCHWWEWFEWLNGMQRCILNSCTRFQEYHVAWCLDTVTSATGFVIYLKTNCHLDDSPLCAITLTGWVSIFWSQSESSWSFYFARGLELLECIWCNLLKKRSFEKIL